MKMPAWLEALVVKALKEFIPASAVAEAIDNAKNALIKQLEDLVAKTDNTFDDAIVAKVKQALTACTPDSAWLCDILVRGEDAVVALLRKAAAETESGLDDALVDLLAEAMKK